MSRNKKPRNKAYRRKEVTYAGGLHLVDSTYRRFRTDFAMPDSQGNGVSMRARMALSNLEQGSASNQSWAYLACAMNVSLILCEQGIGAEYEKTLVLALEGLFKAEQRAQKHGAHRLDGDAMKVLRTALDVHEEHMKVATHSEVIEAMNTVHKRIADGNVYRREAA